MNTKQFWQGAFVIGKFAAFATSWAALAAGAKENRDPISPINAISHIAWGDEAFEQNSMSVKYSFTGLALNAAACVGWGVAMQWLCDKVVQRNSREKTAKTVVTTIACGAAVSSLAYVVDYKIVPARLTPGLEKHLSCRALVFVYAVLALSLAGGALARRK